MTNRLGFSIKKTCGFAKLWESPTCTSRSCPAFFSSTQESKVLYLRNGRSSVATSLNFRSILFPLILGPPKRTSCENWKTMEQNFSCRPPLIVSNLAWGLEVAPPGFLAGSNSVVSEGEAFLCSKGMRVWALKGGSCAMSGLVIRR